jgi:mycothiol synthase
MDHMEDRVSDADSSYTARLMELARSQAGEPSDWSLATDREWLRRMYAGPEAVARMWELPTGQLSASAAVRTGASNQEPEARVVSVTSMLRAGCEDVWDEQRAWIEATLEGAAGPSSAVAQLLSESLGDAEVARWASVGFSVVFEELVMELDLTREDRPSLPQWPGGTRPMDWGPDAAGASFVAYEAAFRDRPGFPGWSQAEWTGRMAGDQDFLPEASLYVLMDDVPAGFVVCSNGWIDQVGVVPAHRRLGLASALVTEATARMRARGLTIARLRVNTNNGGALAAWRALGWRVVGRRGRLERRSTPR